MSRSTGSMRRWSVAMFAAGALSQMAVASAARAQAAQKQDAEYTAQIKQYLSDPRISTELVDHLPASATVPTPLKFFGHIIGAPGKLDQFTERGVVLLGAIVGEDGGVCAADGAEQLLGNVDRILVFGVARDVLQDVHRLERFGKGAGAPAERLVSPSSDARGMLVPEIGEQVSHGAGDVVAVLLVLVEALDADAPRICEHELSHSGDHLAHPAADQATRGSRQGAIARENEVGVPHETHVCGLAGDDGRSCDEAPDRGRIVEAFREIVEQRRLERGGELGRILDRVGDPAQQIRRSDRIAKRRGQEPDAHRERARDRGQNVATENVRAVEAFVHPVRL